MNHSYRKLFLVFAVIMAISLLFGMTATAGVVIEEYNAKLNKTQGVITKIQGKMLTLRTDKGDFITIGVRGESQDDKNRIRRLKIGDRLIIDNGKVMKISAPQKQPLQTPRGAASEQSR